MDSTRFDRITRFFGAATDRRRLLAAGGALATMAFGAGDEVEARNKAKGKGNGKSCKSVGKKKCDGHCFDLKTNRNHCGACGNKCGAGEPCKNGVCVSKPPTVTCGDTTPCTIFVSSTTTNGGFGALTNADKICQDAADAASLPGVYKAWISNTTESAKDRLYHSTSAYILPDGTTTIANDWNALVNAASVGLLHNINQDESGATIIGYAWTSTTGNGTSFGSLNSTCNDWTSTISDPSVKAVYGWVSATNDSWTDGTYGDCNQIQHLYCIQQPIP